MKKLITVIYCLLAYHANALEYEAQFENEHISVAKAKIMPDEEIGLHRDVYPQIVIALKGGTITRLEADGRQTDVNFPTGVAVFRDIDPPNEFHKSVNKGSKPVELIIIQLKSDNGVSK